MDALSKKDNIKTMFQAALLMFTKFIIKVVGIVALVVFTVLVLQWSGWIASWCMQNIFKVPYNSLTGNRAVIFGWIRCVGTGLFLLLLSIVFCRSLIKGLKIMGLCFRLKWYWLIIGIVAIILAIPFFLWICQEIANWVLNNYRSWYYDSSKWATGFEWHTLSTHGTEWGFMIYTSLCAPIGEELIFRGWLYGWLRKIVPGRWFVPIAIIISSLLFGWWHHTNKSALISAVFGLVLCILRECSGNIYGGIIIHALWNYHTFL